MRKPKQEKHAYDARIALWPNRDPIEEGDGPNMYAMVRNNPVNTWNYLGMHRAPPPAVVESFTISRTGYFSAKDAAYSVSMAWRHFSGVKMKLILKPFYTRDMVRIKQETRVTIRIEGRGIASDAAWIPDSRNPHGIWWDGASWTDLDGGTRGLGHNEDGDEFRPKWASLPLRGGHQKEVATFYDTPAFTARNVPGSYPVTYLMQA